MYVTDALRIVTENTAKFASGGYLKHRYIDLIDPQPQDSRSGDEIAQEVIKTAGLVVI